MAADGRVLDLALVVGRARLLEQLLDEHGQYGLAAAAVHDAQEHARFVLRDRRMDRYVREPETEHCLLEGITLGNAVYFSFVTGLTIGYGDIAPETAIGKIVSVVIGLVGTLLVGVIVAVCNRALADTAKRHLDTTA